MLNKRQVVFKTEQLKNKIDKLTGLKCEPVLLAGSALVMHGVRSLTSDVDVSVPHQVMQALMALDHEALDWEAKVVNGVQLIQMPGNFDVSTDGFTCADEIDGMRVASLKDVLAFKQMLITLPDRSEVKKAIDRSDIAVIEAAPV